MTTNQALVAALAGRAKKSVDEGEPFVVSPDEFCELVLLTRAEWEAACASSWGAGWDPDVVPTPTVEASP